MILCILLLYSKQPKLHRKTRKTARAMTNVLNLSVSLRRKTDGSPLSVAQTYWIKKDVSPLFRSQKTAKLQRHRKVDRRTSVVQHGLFLLFGVGLLGGTSETTEA